MSLIFLLLCTTARAQGFSFEDIGGVGIASQPTMSTDEDPVTVSKRTRELKDGTIEVSFDLKIKKGWHVYAPNVSGGPIKASVTIEESKGCKVDTRLKSKPAPIKKYDTAFATEVAFFEDSATLSFTLTPLGGDYVIKGYLEHGACNDNMCLPPSDTEFIISGTKEVLDCASTEESADTTADTASETEVPEEIGAPQATAPTAADGEERDASLLTIFLQSLLAGLVALLTPCVWPMIPLTVSFFIRRNKGRRGRAIAESITYGASIVVIFMVIGLLASIILGANALNALATNGVFNVTLFGILTAFGIALVTGHDVALPSSWSTALNGHAGKAGGALGIFLMAASLVVVSFSCTAPVVGLLLAEVAVSGIGWAALVGMLGFSLALAVPFALFALFPDMMGRLPRSGSWMYTIKVLLGFIEIGLSLKFLSIADLAYGWHILDRETFIAIWVALSTCAAFCFWGTISLTEYSGEAPGAGRLMLGIAAMAFGTYLLPGIWGAPLKSVSAFVPPMSTQDFIAGQCAPAESYDATPETYNSLDKARETAIAKDKKLLIFFTGYGCVNCRKMEQAVLQAPEVRQLLATKYVIAELYVDDKSPLDTAVTVNENGKERRLRTIGDKISHDEVTEYGTAAQPLFVIVDPVTGATEKVPYAYDPEPARFINFLSK